MGIIKSCVMALILLLAIVITSSGEREKKSQRIPMNAFAWDGDCRRLYCAPFSGNTKRNTSCQGALFPSKNEDFFTNFESCFDYITLPGEDLNPYTTDDIVIKRGELYCFRDKETGEVVSIKVWLYDRDNNAFNTDRIPARGQPRPDGFSIWVCQDNILVKPYKKGSRASAVGRISVGVIDYEPK